MTDDGTAVLQNRPNVQNTYNNNASSGQLYGQTTSYNVMNRMATNKITLQWTLASMFSQSFATPFYGSPMIQDTCPDVKI